MKLLDFRPFKLEQLATLVEERKQEFAKRVEAYDAQPNETLEAELEYRHAELINMMESMEFLKGA